LPEIPNRVIVLTLTHLGHCSPPKHVEPYPSLRTPSVHPVFPVDGWNEVGTGPLFQRQFKQEGPARLVSRAHHNAKKE